MPKQLPVFTTPSTGGPLQSEVLRNNFNALQALANDHDATHWPIKLSAPVSGASGISSITGASNIGANMPTPQTKSLKFTYETPNGETTASSEMTCAITSAQNCLIVTVVQADAQFNPYLWVYVAPPGSPSTQWYRAAASDLEAVSNCTIESTGRIVLSTSATSQFRIKSHPATTQPIPPTTNNSGSVDPLNLMVAPMPVQVTVQDNTPSATTYTVTETHSTPTGTMSAIGVYNKVFNPPRMTSLEVRAGAAAVARYTLTYSTNPVTGAAYMSQLTQVEA